MARDKAGCIFLDFNPKHFTVILNHLREKAFTNSDVWIASMSKIASEEVEEFNKFVDYLGLGDLLPKFPTTEAFEFHGRCSGLQDNGTVVVMVSFMVFFPLNSGFPF
jgi:hypothetical protein